MGSVQICLSGWRTVDTFCENTVLTPWCVQKTFTENITVEHFLLFLLALLALTSRNSTFQQCSNFLGYSSSVYWLSSQQKFPEIMLINSDNCRNCQSSRCEGGHAPCLHTCKWNLTRLLVLAHLPQVRRMLWQKINNTTLWVSSGNLWYALFLFVPFLQESDCMDVVLLDQYLTSALSLLF